MPPEGTAKMNLILTIVLITLVFIGTVVVYTLANKNKNKNKDEKEEGWENLKYTILPNLVGFGLYMICLVVLSSMNISLLEFKQLHITFALYLCLNTLLVMAEMLSIDTGAPLGNTCLYVVFLFIWGLQFEWFRKFYIVTRRF